MDQDQQSKFKEWLGRSYGSYEEWLKAREDNKDLDASMERADNRESWVCHECGKMLVADINGNRAKMEVGAGKTKPFVKFREMAAYCDHCGIFNHLAFSADFDWAREADEPGKQRDTFSAEDEKRAGQTALATEKRKQDIVDDYLLKLK